MCDWIADDCSTEEPIHIFSSFRRKGNRLTAEKILSYSLLKNLPMDIIGLTQPKEFVMGSLE
jgi:hypothetical protein